MVESFIKVQKTIAKSRENLLLVATLIFIATTTTIMTYTTSRQPHGYSAESVPYEYNKSDKQPTASPAL
jgi:hypothetical protein